MCPVVAVRLVLQCTNHPLEANSSRPGRLVAFPRLGNRRYCRNIGSPNLCPSMEREFESVLGMQRVQHPTNRTHGFPRLALGTAKAARVNETSKMEYAGPTIHGERNGGWKCRQHAPAAMERIEAGEKAGNSGQDAAGLGKVGDGKVTK